MRELKFRAWDKVKKIWIPGGYGFHILGEAMLLGGLFHDYKIEQLNNIILTQFTGLKDKNGKEIFEGDILGDVWGNKGAVVWDLKTACFNKVGGCEFAEIIGNILETPELLK